MEKEVFTVNLEKVIREMKLDRLYYPNKEVLIDTAEPYSGFWYGREYVSRRIVF